VYVCVCVKERDGERGREREAPPNNMVGGYGDITCIVMRGVVASVSNQPTTILYGGAGGRRPGAVVTVEYCHCEFIEDLSSIIYNIHIQYIMYVKILI